MTPRRRGRKRYRVIPNVEGMGGCHGPADRCALKPTEILRSEQSGAIAFSALGRRQHTSNGSSLWRLHRDESSCNFIGVQYRSALGCCRTSPCDLFEDVTAHFVSGKANNGKTYDPSLPRLSIATWTIRSHRGLAWPITRAGASPPPPTMRTWFLSTGERSNFSATRNCVTVTVAQCKS